MEKLYAQNSPSAFNSTNNPENFPVARLPTRLQCSLASFMHSTDAPLSAVASVMLGVMSISCQQRYVVEKRNDLTSPLTLWMLVLQESGERKSTVLNALLEGVREFESSRLEAIEQNRREWETRHELWQLAMRRLKKTAEELSEKPEKINEIAERITSHLESEPKITNHLRPILEDTTSEALIQSIHETGGCATSIVSDEMIRILKGRALNDLGLLCKGYDGSPVQVSRVKHGNIYLERPLISMLLMGQNAIFDELIKKHGSEWNSSGFTARFLIAKSWPRAGTRYINNCADLYQSDRSWFSKRCMALLVEADEEVAKKRQTIKKLKFSAAAAQYWVDYYNHVENNVAPGRAYDKIKSFASRLADKAAKIAALIHVFENESHEEIISLESLICGVDIAEWYASQYMDVFGVAASWDCESDAASLKSFMQHRFQLKGQIDFSRTELLQYGPSRVRSRHRLNAALDALRWQAVVVLFHAPNGRIVIRLNSWFTNYGAFHQPIQDI